MSFTVTSTATVLSGNADLNKFKQAFAPAGGTYNAGFDFINNGANITNSDLNQLKTRFLKNFSYS